MPNAAVDLYLQISEYGIVSATALLVFDYCLTVGQVEVEWVYGTRWTAARIHFTSLRYMPFPALALAIASSYSGSVYCGSLGKATNGMYYLCIVLAEAMLIVRTYAFWKQNRKILIGICTFSVVCIVIALVVAVAIVPRSTNAVYHTLDCVGLEGTAGTASQYICLIVYELGMLSLNWIAFHKIKRQNPPGRLITTLHRDGVMYMAAILVFSVINAVVTLATPIQYSDILNSPQMAMHSILASRIFFNLRETARREGMGTRSSVFLTEFHATSQGSSASGSS